MIKLTALLPNDRGGAVLSFEITDHEGNSVGNYLIFETPTEHGNTDSLIGRGYRQMASTLREWEVYLSDRAAAYEAKSAG